MFASDVHCKAVSLIGAGADGLEEAEVKALKRDIKLGDTVAVVGTKMEAEDGLPRVLHISSFKFVLMRTGGNTVHHPSLPFDTLEASSPSLPTLPLTAGVTLAPPCPSTHCRRHSCTYLPFHSLHSTIDRPQDTN